MSLCDYGCGQEGQYKLKNGKMCCSSHYLKCPANREKRRGKNNPFYGKTHNSEAKNKLREQMTGKAMPKFRKLENNTNIYCKFDCGNLAKYVSINNEFYCEDNASKCPVIKNINRNKNMGTANSKRQKFKRFINTERLLCDYGCGEVARYKNKNGKICCSEYITQCEARKAKRYKIEDYKKKYPLFSKIEEMRYNPDKPGEIQVHCKNHNCPNSKEKGGWFTPTKTQFYERVRNIEKFNLDRLYFYCSNECKKVCPLYRFRGNDPLSKNKNASYTTEEYNQFRQYVLERDKYKCQYCGKKAEHVHHERPQKLEPFFALDSDLAWSVCRECHYKYGHQDECSTGNLANKIC